MPEGGPAHTGEGEEGEAAGHDGGKVKEDEGATESGENVTLCLLPRWTLSSVLIKTLIMGKGVNRSEFIAKEAVQRQAKN